MNKTYELVGGPIDGGIITLEDGGPRLSVLRMPNSKDFLYYQSDPQDDYKLLFIGSLHSDSDIVPSPSKLPQYRGPHAAN
jgi:hypothetical protein